MPLHLRGDEVTATVTALHWRGIAACRDSDPELFFGPDGEDEQAAADREEQARAVCARCPVRKACAAFAVSAGAKHGTWGGMNPDERELRARRDRTRHLRERRRAA